MKRALSDEIFMLAVGAMGAVVARFPFDGMLAAPLTASERAIITGFASTKDCAFVVMAALGELVFDFVKVIHLSPILFRGEFVKRGLVLALGISIPVSTFRDATLNRTSLLPLWGATVGRVTTFLGAGADLTSHPRNSGIMFLLVLALELLGKSFLDFRIQKPDTVTHTLEPPLMEPVCHAVA